MTHACLRAAPCFREQPFAASKYEDPLDISLAQHPPAPQGCGRFVGW